MGMSHDFEIAIEEGATIVSVGTAIFGARRKLAALNYQYESKKCDFRELSLIYNYAFENLPIYPNSRYLRDAGFCYRFAYAADFQLFRPESVRESRQIFLQTQKSD